jgi:threonine aldolase
MESIYAIAKKHNIPIHLDGARLFNAAASLKTDVKEVTKYCDSVMFCLSKGLCAPVGSMLAGTKDFIDKARKGRKLMGGGLRQVGFLAAAGLVALKEMTSRLQEDHENALLLADKLLEIPGISLNKEDIHINMVFFNGSALGYDLDRLVQEFYNRGIKINSAENGEFRFVTNYWVKKEDIEYVITSFKEILQNY